MKRFLIIILFFISIALQGQRIIEQGNKAFMRRDFAKALTIYAEALDKTNNILKRQEIYFRMGRCHDVQNDYASALKHYENSYREGNNSPELFKYMGAALLKLGEYDDAKDFLEKYLDSNPDDKYVKNLIGSCKYAIKNRKAVPDMHIQNQHDLNSQYAEYGLALIDNQLLFTSTRIDSDSSLIYGVNGQAYGNYYRSEFNEETGVWMLPMKIQDQINTTYNEGTSVFDRHSNTLYFMVCNGLSGDKNTCAIYSSGLDKLNNRWSSPKLIYLGSDKYNYGHPALTGDGNKLYFVSDMPGGYGNKDIWYVEKMNRTVWGVPKNMGPKVNTAGDEMFPYVFDDSRLYFSSDGHPGYGGLDIFYVDISDIQNGKVENAGLPINSSADDFDPLVFSTDSGLFCSNRPGGVGDDDIYSFYKKKENFSIEGFIRDRNNNKPLVNALVLLGSEENAIDSVRTDDSGSYTFKNVETGKGYAVTVYKEGYLGDVDYVEPKSSTRVGKVRDIDNLRFDMIKMTDEEIRLRNIYYDFGKWNLTEGSKKELDNLVDLLMVNPGVRIRINSHTDDVGKDEFNMELSKYRAQSVVNYLIENGVDASRLSFKGWGETSPYIANAQTDEDRKLNRRTTFQIVNLNDVDISYTPARYVQLAETIAVDRQSQTGFNDDREGGRRKDVVFRLQVYAGKRKMSRAYKNRLEGFAGRYEIIMTKGNDGMYRYAIGDFKKFDQAMAMQEILKENDYESFVIAFMNDLRITILEARQMSQKYTNY